MKGLGNSSKKVENIVGVGLFAAICYVAIMLFRIPYPAPVGNPFIHFGNLFVILCALLYSLIGALLHFAVVCNNEEKKKIYRLMQKKLLKKP